MNKRLATVILKNCFFFPVEVGENVTEILPTFAVEPENTTTVLEGDKVIIECAGQGYPNPIEAWKVPHHIIIPDGLHIDNTGMLIFENVSRSHTGIYICIIEDSQSRKEVARKQIMLDVKGEAVEITILLLLYYGSSNQPQH